MARARKHDWDIFGIVMKPRIKKRYINNVVLTCSHCEQVLMTLNNRHVTFRKFTDLNDFAHFCLPNGYIVKVWPSLK